MKFLETNNRRIISKSAFSDGVMREEYFKGVVKEAIKILGEYLPPDGIDSKETISRLLGIFDNKEIVEKLRSA